ncbi:MAG: hypothetical protein RL769_470 [Pseudomonadota bacterium]|jgi:hypothetical protein
MITYLKEISTGILHKFDETSSPAHPNLFIPATQSEIENLLLTEAKEKKLKELIDIYNQSISKPHPIIQAPKLDQLNQPVGFVDAFFYIKDPEILKQETTIVFGGLFLTILKYFELTNSKHNETLTTALKSSIPIPYITKDKDGNEVKIHLTGAEVYNIFRHLFTRLQTQSGVCENLKIQIEQANSIADLEKVNLEILKK